MSSQTVAQLIDEARSRHTTFANTDVPEGAILTALNSRQRSLILMYGGSIDGLVNTTASIATVIAGVLVGSTGGVPTYVTTYADGWAVHQDVSGVPYVDMSEAPVAGDPFGEHGGTPGFPLPTDFLKLILATVVFTDNRVGPLQIISESARLGQTRFPTPTAFLSGNRLVPVRPLSTGNTGDVWASGIASVQLSYVALPVVTALSDLVTLPAALTEALTAGMADFLAKRAPGLSNAEKQQFAAESRRTEELMMEYGVDVVAAASTGVRYRG